MEKCSQCNNKSNNLIPIARKGAVNSDCLTTKYICAECLGKSLQYEECSHCSDFGNKVAYHVEDLTCVEELGSTIHLCHECFNEYIEEREPASEEEADGINDLLEHYN